MSLNSFSINYLIYTSAFIFSCRQNHVPTVLRQNLTIWSRRFWVCRPLFDTTTGTYVHEVRDIARDNQIVSERLAASFYNKACQIVLTAILYCTMYTLYHQTNNVSFLFDSHSKAWNEVNHSRVWPPLVSTNCRDFIFNFQKSSVNCNLGWSDEAFCILLFSLSRFKCSIMEVFCTDFKCSMCLA